MRGSVGNWPPSLGEQDQLLLDDLHALAIRGLSTMFLPQKQQFPQTVRGRVTSAGPALRAEGSSVRYSAICALGLATLAEAEVTATLAGQSLDVLLARTRRSALEPGRDPGSIALAGWAEAELTCGIHAPLLSAVEALVQAPHMTVVELAWVLDAWLAAFRAGATTDTWIARAAADRLAAVQGPGGLFPHHVEPSDSPGWRRHVGCFADQVYPIHALARASAVLADPRMLSVAAKTAEAICELQGEAGQWWWHYDSRGRRVVEGFPVYSVHQHAMAPLALRELAEAGGPVHSDAVLSGLRWLVTHPETLAPLIDHGLAVVWRKVGRREPRKAVRGAAALATAVHPRLSIPGVGTLFPATEIDYECRPYELGWLLYAWRGRDSGGDGSDDH